MSIIKASGKSAFLPGAIDKPVALARGPSPYGSV